MAGSPRFKVYNPQGEYVASCKLPEDAAMIVAGYGDDAEIRLGHKRIVWMEGAERQPAGESFDFVALTVYQRLGEAQ